MLTFKDFIPQVQTKVLGFATGYENIHEVLTRVNRWLEQGDIQVLGVETLLLPTLPNQSAESAPARMTGASSSTGTFQVIRVWYQEQPATDSGYTGSTIRLALSDPADE